MKVLFLPSAVGRGHVGRVRPIIRALSQAGHESQAAMLGRRAAALLNDLCDVELPEQPLPVPPRVGRSPAFVGIRDFGMSLAFHTADSDSSLSILRYLNSAIDRHKPDVVVVDQVVYGGPAARSRGIPVVQLTHGPYFPGQGQWTGPDDDGEYPDVLPLVQEVFDGCGLAAPVSLDHLLVGDAYICPSPEKMGTLKGAVHYDEPADLPDQVGGVRVERRGKPLVAMALGGSPQVLEDALAGVRAAGAEPVILDDRSDEVADRQRASERRLGRVRLDAVLPQTDAVVHHGGAGTTVDALRGGVPAVIVPAQQERLLNAEYAAGLGAAEIVPVAPGPMTRLELGRGIVARGHIQPVDLAARVAAATTRVLDGSFSDGVDAGRAAMRALPGVDAAVATILSLG